MKGKAKFKFDHWTTADEPIPEDEVRVLELDCSGGFSTGAVLTGTVEIDPEKVHHLVSMLRQGKVPVFIMELDE